MIILNRPWLLMLFAYRVFIFSLSTSFSHATIYGVPCSTNNDCSDSQGLIQGVSVCENGKCTNPFEQGCLNVMSEKYGKKNIPFPSAFETTRICNSDDDATPEDDKNCRKATLADYFLYDEVRVAPGNWESSIILGWITQILLTEVLEVPVTLEHSDGKKGVGSFYDRTNGFTFASELNHAVIWEAERVNGDCSKTDKPCGHIIPEVWSGSLSSVVLNDERMLPQVPNGVIGRTGYYIPEFTAKNHPELSTFYGLAGEENRHNLAANFLTPITWQLYCDNFTASSNCIDSVASGPPLDEYEGAKYYEQGRYTGHFYTPPEGNCTINPKTCAGHYVNANCNWASYGDNLMHWHNISLISRGPLELNSGYEYNSMVEVWNAAIETKNNVMMWWWYPDSLVEVYENTEARLVRIDFPKTNEKCLRWRQENIEICSQEEERRRGEEPIGSCDAPVEKLTRLFGASLKKRHKNATKAKRSPAYPMIRRLKIQPYAMDDIFRHWLSIGKDYYGYDSREATCKYVYDNIEMLVEHYFPKGYPKQINVRKSISFVVVSYVISGIALITMLLIAALLMVMFKERQSMRNEQFEFIFCIIAGLSLITIGAIAGAFPSSNGTCTTSEWSILIGYTLVQATIFVKVEAMNTICRSGNIHLDHIEIDPKKLKKYLIVFIIPVLIFLIIWTAVDMPEPLDLLTMNSDDVSEKIINLDSYCSSVSIVWSVLGYMWQLLLLLSSVVLVCQFQGIEDIKESQYIAFMAYSNFVFWIFRIVARALTLYQSIPGTVGCAIGSMLLSCDVLTGAMIYFGPKFYNILCENSTKNLMSTGLAGASPVENKNSESSDLSKLLKLRKAGINVIRKSTETN